MRIRYFYIDFRYPTLDYRGGFTTVRSAILWRRRNTTAGVGYTNSTLAVF